MSSYPLVTLQDKRLLYPRHVHRHKTLRRTCTMGDQRKVITTFIRHELSVRSSPLHFRAMTLNFLFFQE